MKYQICDKCGSRLGKLSKPRTGHAVLWIEKKPGYCRLPKGYRWVRVGEIIRESDLKPSWITNLWEGNSLYGEKNTMPLYYIRRK